VLRAYREAAVGRIDCGFASGADGAKTLELDWLVFIVPPLTRDPCANNAMHEVKLL
jgi:hypothetical protein